MILKDRNIEKPCVPFFNKTKHIMKPIQSLIFLTFTRESLVKQFTNLDIEKKSTILIHIK